MVTHSTVLDIIEVRLNAKWYISSVGARTGGWDEVGCFHRRRRCRRRRRRRPQGVKWCGLKSSCLGLMWQDKIPAVAIKFRNKRQTKIDTKGTWNG